MLEICPTSNLLTGALPDADAVRATFRAFLEAGVRVTVSTDGPEMMRTHLRDEFAFLCEIDALSEDEARAANALAHASSFVRSRRTSPGRTLDRPGGLAYAAAAMPDTLKRTPLHAGHRALGARLVPFAGWEMPVQYAGVIDEHRAVREDAGLFDVSHMGQVESSAATARTPSCRACCPTTSTASRPHEAQYTLLPNEPGGIVDDLIVYRRPDGATCWSSTPATRGGRRAPRGAAPGGDVELDDRSDRARHGRAAGPEALALRPVPASRRRRGGGRAARRPGAVHLGPPARGRRRLHSSRARATPASRASS